jgi:hypothetical protein
MRNLENSTLAPIQPNIRKFQRVLCTSGQSRRVLCLEGTTCQSTTFLFVHLSWRHVTHNLLRSNNTACVVMTLPVFWWHCLQWHYLHSDDTAFNDTACVLMTLPAFWWHCLQWHYLHSDDTAFNDTACVLMTLPSMTLPALTFRRYCLRCSNTCPALRSSFYTLVWTVLCTA